MFSQERSSLGLTLVTRRLSQEASLHEQKLVKANLFAALTTGISLRDVCKTRKGQQL